jgi:prespore-specific regulator
MGQMGVSETKLASDYFPRRHRNDAWTEQDDSILTEIVLRQIREGGSQLEGFDESAQILNHTSAACAYRWNGVVRHRNTNEINEAKMARRQNFAKRMSKREQRKQLGSEVIAHIGNEPLTLDMLVGGLQSFAQRYHDMEKELAQLKGEGNAEH